MTRGSSTHQATGESRAPAPGKRTYRAGELPRELWSVLRSTPRLIAVYRRRRLDPAMREGIMAAVSEVNACRYCTVAHETWEARMLSQARVFEPAAPGVERAESRRLAVAYAIACAEAHPRAVAPDLESAVDRHFDERERSDLDAVIRLAMFTNLTMNSLEALLNRRRRPGQDNDRSQLDG